ncbi:MAG TPA: heat-inducible transcriptional repressor HrcA [Bryobacteraceae bacterium]|nr:heat-inducible transcriptional repressor HrcA [Bryobacteraceae bacterium]
MSRPPAPASRHTAVLHAIVEQYIETGEPVASRTIAKRIPETLSSASIRNIMADLCDEGYLAQPHTSAGRIPTEKAFQSYVRALNARRILSAELTRIRSELDRLETLQERVEYSSHLLVEMTRGFGIAAAIPTPGQTLDQVDLLALADRRVLMIVATRDHMVHSRVVAMNQPVAAEELESIRNYLNANFSGWLLPDIRLELERRLNEERAAFDAVLRKLHLLYSSGLLDFGVQPEIHTEGASNLIGLDLHLTREKMRDLFQALEQKKKVLHLLERFLEEPHGELAVRVGLEEAHPAMGGFSLIGVNLQLPGGVVGKLAVLGPMRMNYGRVISAVLHVGEALGGGPRPA